MGPWEARTQSNDPTVVKSGHWEPLTYLMFRLSYATASGGRRDVVLLELIVVRKYYLLTITEYIHRKFLSSISPLNSSPSQNMISKL
jgi:hypothetical protein